MGVLAAWHSDCATESPRRDGDKYRRVARPARLVCSFTSILVVYIFLLLFVVDSDQMRRSIGFTGGFLMSLVQALSMRKWSNESFGPLRFSDDGTFQISIFEDLHFGESKIKGILRWLIR